MKEDKSRRGGSGPDSRRIELESLLQEIESRPDPSPLKSETKRLARNIRKALTDSQFR